MELKHSDSLEKKKFKVQQSVKEVMLTVFCDMKGPIAIDSLEKVQLLTVLSIANPWSKIHLIYWMASYFNFFLTLYIW